MNNKAPNDFVLDMGLTSFSDDEVEKFIMNDSVLRYYFALNGGAGPVSTKGYKIFRAIEHAIRSYDQQKMAEPSGQDERDVESQACQVWRSDQPSSCEHASEEEYLNTDQAEVMRSRRAKILT